MFLTWITNDLVIHGLYSLWPMGGLKVGLRGNTTTYATFADYYRII